MSENRFDEILKEINEIKTELREFKAIIMTKIEAKQLECNYHKNDLIYIKKEIEGNGKKGIKSRLDELEKFEVKVISYATIIFSVINFIIIKLLK